MQSGQLTDLIKSLRSKHLENIAPTEPKVINARKNEIFKLQNADHDETIGE